jgi:hypothetical protein
MEKCPYCGSKNGHDTERSFVHQNNKPLTKRPIIKTLKDKKMANQ